MQLKTKQKNAVLSNNHNPPTISQGLTPQSDKLNSQNIQKSLSKHSSTDNQTVKNNDSLFIMKQIFQRPYFTSDDLYYIAQQSHECSQSMIILQTEAQKTNLTKQQFINKSIQSIKKSLLQKQLSQSFKGIKSQNQSKQKQHSINISKSIKINTQKFYQNVAQNKPIQAMSNSSENKAIRHQQFDNAKVKQHTFFNSQGSIYKPNQKIQTRKQEMKQILMKNQQPSSEKDNQLKLFPAINEQKLSSTSEQCQSNQFNKLLQITGRCVQYYNKFNNEKQSQFFIIQKTFNELNQNLNSAFEQIIIEVVKKQTQLKQFLYKKYRQIIQYKNNQNQKLKETLQNIKSIHLPSLLKEKNDSVIRQNNNLVGKQKYGAYLSQKVQYLSQFDLLNSSKQNLLQKSQLLNKGTKNLNHQTDDPKYQNPNNFTHPQSQKQKHQLSNNQNISWSSDKSDQLSLQLHNFAATLNIFYCLIQEIQKTNYKDMVEQSISFINNLITEEIKSVLCEKIPQKLLEKRMVRQSSKDFLLDQSFQSQEFRCSIIDGESFLKLFHEPSKQQIQEIFQTQKNNGFNTRNDEKSKIATKQLQQRQNRQSKNAHQLPYNKSQSNQHNSLNQHKDQPNKFNQPVNKESTFIQKIFPQSQINQSSKNKQPQPKRNSYSSISASKTSIAPNIQSIKNNINCTYQSSSKNINSNLQKCVSQQKNISRQKISSNGKNIKRQTSTEQIHNTLIDTIKKNSEKNTIISKFNIQSKKQSISHQSQSSEKFNNNHVQTSRSIKEPNQAPKVQDQNSSDLIKRIASQQNNRSAKIKNYLQNFQTNFQQDCYPAQSQNYNNSQKVINNQKQKQKSPLMIKDKNTKSPSKYNSKQKKLRQSQNKIININSNPETKQFAISPKKYIPRIPSSNNSIPDKNNNVPSSRKSKQNIILLKNTSKRTSLEGSNVQQRSNHIEFNSNLNRSATVQNNNKIYRNSVSVSDFKIGQDSRERCSFKKF